MKKIALMFMIVALCVSAGISIMVTLLGMWNVTTIKLLLTSSIVFGFSIPSLLCVLLLEKEKNKIIAFIGMIICLFTCLYSLYVCWFDNNLLFLDSTSKILSTGTILSVFFGHISLLLIMKTNDSLSKTVRFLTITVASVMAFCSILMSDFEIDVAWQLVFILFVLSFVGTLLVPIIDKVKTKNTVDNNYLNNNIADKYDQLNKLKQLLDNNIITEEEYNIEKSKILNN